MKKLIITLTIAMLTVTTVNAQSWRNKSGNGRNNSTTVIVNNDRRGSDVTIVNNSHNSNVTVINCDKRPSNDRFNRPNDARHDHPTVGQRVDNLPCGAVKTHRNGREYYRVGNVLYDKIATVTGIVYSVVQLLNS